MRKTMSSSVEMQAFHYIPDPLPQQIRALDRTVESVVSDRGLSSAEATGYFETAERLESFVRQHKDDVKMQVFGAVLSGCALKDGVVNVCVSGNRPAPSVLVQVYRILQRYGGAQFINVEGDFTGRGSVKVEEAESGRQLTLVINCDTDVLTSQLLHIYFSTDQRAQKLAVMLRCWAQICRLDRPEDGTLPAYAFDILVIYFLQQVGSPVLPVLPLPQNAGKWRSHPDIVNRLKSQAEAWKSDNQSSGGELWVQLLRFYCCQFDIASLVVSVRCWTPLTNREKGWSDGNLSIEDPLCVEQNVARSIQSPVVMGLFWANWRRAYDYFAMPRNRTGKPLVCPSSFSWTTQPQQQEEWVMFGSEVNKADPGKKEAATTQCLEPADATFLPAKDADATTGAVVGGDDDANEASKLSEVLKAPGTEGVREGGGVPQGAEEENVFTYELYCDVFTKGETPKPKCCRLCGKAGHTRKECKEMERERERERPVFHIPNTTTPHHLELVDRVITQILSDFSPMEKDIKNRSQFLEKLTGYVQTVYPDARVGVYGSTMSGFNFYSSDLDISISFQKAEKRGGGGGPLRSLDRVARILRGTKEFSYIQVIEMARVPIVKFRHTHTQLEGDISFCNSLAMYNTRLLRCYSRIDERVKTMGLAVKVLAKVCNIGDASLGSLSSYSYILMMIHYLQQCSPPVIPVLQEIYPEGGKPETEEFMIDGCNVWFFEDLKRLPNVWPGHGQNTQSLGSLWLGFLRYYATQFDWKGSVVSIRQAEMLTKFEKGWVSKRLAIEDPFLLNRNLGGNLSNWGDACISHTFQCGAVHFWTPVEKVLVDPSEYFFDVRMLTGGHDKAAYYCPACSEFGHVFGECPDRAFQTEDHQTQDAEVNAEVKASPVAIVKAPPVAIVKALPVAIVKALPVAIVKAPPVTIVKASPVLISGPKKNKRRKKKKQARKEQPEKAEKSSSSDTNAGTDPATGTSRVGKTEMPDCETHPSENTGAPVSGQNRAEKSGREKKAIPQEGLNQTKNTGSLVSGKGRNEKKAIPQEGLNQSKNTGSQFSGKNRSEKTEHGQKEIPQEGVNQTKKSRQKKKKGPGCPSVQEKKVEDQQQTTSDHRAEGGRQATPSARVLVEQQSSEWLRLLRSPANEDRSPAVTVHSGDHSPEVMHSPDDSYDPSPVVTIHSEDSEHRSPVVTIHSDDTVDSEHRSPVVTIHSDDTVDSEHRSPVVTIHSEDCEDRSPVVTIHSNDTVDNEHRSPVVSIHSDDTVDSEDPSPLVKIHSDDTIDSEDPSPLVTIHSDNTIDSDDPSPEVTIHSEVSDDHLPEVTIHPEDTVNSDDHSLETTIHSDDSDDRSPVPMHHPVFLDSKPLMVVLPVRQCPTPSDQPNRAELLPVQSWETSQLSARHTEHSATGSDSQSGLYTEHSDTGADSLSGSLGWEMLRIQLQQQKLIQQQLQLIRQQQAVEQQLLQQQLADSRMMSSRVLNCASCHPPPAPPPPDENSKKSGSGTKENQTQE